MDLKNKKQELVELLSKISSNSSYDEIISLCQKAVVLSAELKIGEILHENFNQKIKEVESKEAIRFAEIVRQVQQGMNENLEIIKPEKPTVAQPLIVEEKKEELLAVSEVEKQIIKPIQRTTTLSEKLATADNTLATKLGKSPIKDLTKALNLNQKMLFTKELFKGDSLAMNDAIIKLNNFQNKEEAFSFLKTELQAKYGWREEMESFTHLKELIERRYV